MVFNKVKKFLLKNNFIYKLNADNKCKKIKQQYKSITEHYSNYDLIHENKYLLIEKGFNQSWENKFTDRKISTFYLGTDEYQDKSGILNSLSKFTDLKYFTQKDGSYGHAKYYDKLYKINTSDRLRDLFNIYGKEIDILIMQSWGSTIDVKTLLYLKKKYDFKIIQISMDDRHTFWINGNPSNGVAELLPAIDIALTAACECVNWYNIENVPSFYFPEASCSEIFYPLNIQKVYDVGFVGAKYGIRQKIINKLKQNGFNVVCYGNGWSNGRLPLEKTNEFYNKCKIVLGIGTIGYCEDFYSLKMRDFDVPMSGSCYVTSCNPDLLNLYNNDEIGLYKNIDDCINQISYIIKDKKYLEMGYKALRRASSEHTYDHRIRSIFKNIGIQL